MTILSSPIGADYRPATAAAVTVLADAGVPVHLPGTEAYAALTGTSNLTKAIRPVARRRRARRRRTSAARCAWRRRRGCGSRSRARATARPRPCRTRSWSAPPPSTSSPCTPTSAGPASAPACGGRPSSRRARRTGSPGLAGSSPDVGVVGYLTGGGLGPVARTHGLASDTVRAFEVVTGDGVARRVTATNHPELFWGLRGGKGTLGIVTAVEIDLVEQAELYAGALWFAAADALRRGPHLEPVVRRAARGGHHVDRRHAPARPADVPRAAARHDVGRRAVRVDG